MVMEFLVTAIHHLSASEILLVNVVWFSVTKND